MILYSRTTGDLPIVEFVMSAFTPCIKYPYERLEGQICEEQAPLDQIILAGYRKTTETVFHETEDGTAPL